MNRILPLAAWEVRIQFRQGIYYAAAFVVVVMAVVLAQLPRAWSFWRR